MPQRAFVWGAAGFATFLVLYLVWGALGFPGAPDSCLLPGGNCYCEAPHDAPAIQPANTWSNLAAVVAGLLILWIADRERVGTPGLGRSPSNPMTTGGFYAIAYGAVVLFLGPGSMAFHGSLTRFGGWLDTLSMILFITFVLFYDAERIFRFSERTFFGLYAGLAAVLGAFTWFVDGSGTIVFGVGVLLAVLLEVAFGLWGIGVKRPLSRWLAAGIGTFILAIIIWRLSWTGAPLCVPDSILQGHAVWHVLAEAVAPFFFFLHFRGESS
jgi:hypothetical protein